MLDLLAESLAWPFVWRAVVAGVLIALCASLLGVSLVLRRLSFMGDGLSHVAFGAMAVAGALGLAGGGLALALPLTALCAVFLLRGGAGRGRGDASLAMLSVGAMAAGYLLMHLFPSSSNVSGDVCTTLFGAVSLLTLTNAETWLCAGLSLAVILFHALTYHRNFDVAFDEDFARASGANTALFNLASAVVTAVVIVVSMRLVGALLVSALLVFPAVTALRVGRSFRSVTLLAAAFSVVFALTGILVAVVAGTPVGATIVAVEVLALVLVRARAWALVLVLGCGLMVLWSYGRIARPSDHQTDHPTIRPSDHPATIVATTFPLYDWTRNVLGERTNEVSLVLLQKNGGDLHSFQPTARDIRDIAACDLFLYIGGESDDWVPDVLAANPNPTRRTLALLPRLPPRAHTHHHHDHDDHDHSTLRPSDHQTDHQDEHIWLSLRDAQRCVAMIAEAVSALDPDHAADTLARATRYTAALAALDAEYARCWSDGRMVESSDGIANAESQSRRELPYLGEHPPPPASAPLRLCVKTPSGHPTIRPSDHPTFLFADRFPFARLADDYGLDCIAAFHGCSAEAEASFGVVAHLAHELDEHGCRVVYVLEDGDRRLAEAVCAAAQARDVRIETVDSLQHVPASALGTASYLDAMRRNLSVLRLAGSRLDQGER